MMKSMPRFGPRVRLSLMVVAGLAAVTFVGWPHQGGVRHAIAQDEIPDAEFPSFEAEYDLRYHFPSSPVAIIDPVRDFDLPSAMMRLRVRAVETIKRGDRVTRIRSVGVIDLLLTAGAPTPEQAAEIAAVSAASSDHEAVKLCWYPFRMRHDRTTDRRRRTYLLDPAQGFVERDASGQVLNEANYEKGSSLFAGENLLTVLSRPGSYVMRNGALQDDPAQSPVFDVSNIDWLMGVTASLVPPLPTATVRESTRWKAGVPVLVSMFAEPEYIRSGFRMTMLDPETGAVGVEWEGTERNLSVQPRPGIHHLSHGGVAVVEASGQILIDPKTGRVRSSRIRSKASVVDPQSPNQMVEFVLVMSLEAMFPKTEGGRVVAEVAAESDN